MDASPLTPDELLTGFVFGTEPRELPAVDVDPLTALQDALRPALRRAPCVVAFSGGRDSSAVLAAATDLARREGLAPPVAATLEHAAETTRETEWQERVLGHLGLERWIRVAVGDELDLVGAVATGVAERHGVRWPANAHMIAPLARHAAGGSLVTGFCGDDVIGTWPWNGVADVLAGRRRPRPGDLRRGAHWLAPVAVKAELLRRSGQLFPMPWLREPERGRLGRRVARELAAEPRLWSSKMRRTHRRRLWSEAVRTLELVGSDLDATVYTPFLDARFLAALARDGGRWGWGNRTATMAALFGGLLPSEIVTRRTKALFGPMYFGERTRRFAAEWDGRAGIDPAVVDPEALRAVWSAEEPLSGAACLLQAAWQAAGRRLDRSPPAAGVGA